MQAANNITALPLLHCSMHIDVCDGTFRRTLPTPPPPNLACSHASALLNTQAAGWVPPPPHTASNS